MKISQNSMGMLATIEVVDSTVRPEDIDQIYRAWQEIDMQFSTYKPRSEISQINAGKLLEYEYSSEMQEVLDACEQTRLQTHGYFNCRQDGYIDPSGYVKGWAIQKGALALSQMGYCNYYIEIAGDIQLAGCNAEGEFWKIGIQNPFNSQEIVKRVELTDCAIATSGTYLQGQHIHNPHCPKQKLTEVVSISVISQNIVDADRFATAAFAMGSAGISFVSGLDGFEAYQINSEGIATYTSGFNAYTT